VLSVGLVVDDAIVVVENVERHMREGKTPFDAAIHGARELVGPIIAMTITLAAVYAPIGLQGGLTGSLFREFAFTLAGAVMISGVVALTLSPMMSATLLDDKVEHHWLPTRINATFEKLRAAYARVLDGALSARPAVYVIWIVLTLLAIPMWMFSANELAPTEDQGIIFGIAEASANSTIDQTRKFSNAAHDMLMAVPERKFVFQHTGPSEGCFRPGRIASAPRLKSCRSCRGSSRRSRVSRCSPPCLRHCRAAASSRSNSSSPRPLT
jgi:multidrug efflux pump